MKLLKMIFTPLSWVVYICIAAYLFIAAPLALGYRPVVVLSGSMEPTYPVGSVIYYKSAPFDQIAEGDAITFRTGEDALVTHRVVQKNEISASFVTKGDANTTEDSGEVRYDDVAGKVGWICIPYAGYAVSYGRQPAVIGVMAVILIVSIFLDGKSSEGKKKAKE